jgi:transketolase
MRSQFVQTISQLMPAEKRLVLMLGDIGVFGFRNLLKDYPSRTYNIGILEQASVSLAAGLSLTGMIPVFHTIAPFIVERAYEQLKVDFGYQKLNGNFVSVGASYDYAGLGCTHHCPADIGVLKLIPNMSIICPGTSEEFDALFKAGIHKDGPKYYRLSETQNKESQSVEFGKAQMLKKGRNGIVIAVGTMLDRVISACEGLDVTIFYYTSIAPFDSKALASIINDGERIVICEPYYFEGGITTNVVQAAQGKAISMLNIGIPTTFSNQYGSLQEHDAFHRLDTESITVDIKKFLGNL